jgi:hypothetical protein
VTYYSANLGLITRFLLAMARDDRVEQFIPPDVWHVVSFFSPPANNEKISDHLSHDKYWKHDEIMRWWRNTRGWRYTFSEADVDDWKKYCVNQSYSSYFKTLARRNCLKDRLSPLESHNTILLFRWTRKSQT